MDRVEYALPAAEGGRLAWLYRHGEVVNREERKVTLRVPKAETPAVTARALQQLPVADLTVEDPPIEEVIEHAFSGTRDGG